jgi:hypothetical protein
MLNNGQSAAKPRIEEGSFRKEVGCKRNRSGVHPLLGEDMIYTLPKGRGQRNVASTA